MRQSLSLAEQSILTTLSSGTVTTQKDVLKLRGLTSMVSGRLTGQRYLDLLRDHIIPSLGDTSELWFMQDGAPAHKARVVTQYLRAVFGDRVIALGWDPEWAPRSPDVTPCDFFLWGYMKDKVYGKRLANRISLKEKIWEVFPSIEQEKIRDACRGVERKLQDLVELEGEHIQFARGR